jgi:hypothetical protein
MRSFIILLVALATACQENTTDNFINPPPGVPATCAQIAALPGCDQGSISYSCTSDRPDDVGSDAGKGDTAQLVCSDGAAGADGEALYCCIPISQYYTECAPADVSGCGATSVGFACANQRGSSYQGDPPLAPSDVDPTIACSAAMPGSGGALDYCCNTAAIPPQCAVDPSVSCAGIGVGYSCAVGATPGDDAPSLACAAGSAGSDGVGYCCVPFAQSADTCVIDDTLGCAAGELAFTCSGANTPNALDPALACAEGARGYCCTVGG